MSYATREEIAAAAPAARMSALALVVASGDVEAIGPLLDQYTLDRCEPDSRQMRLAAAEAAKNGHLPMLRLLEGRGLVRPEAVLCFAAAGGRADVVRWVYEHGPKCGQHGPKCGQHCEHGPKCGQHCEHGPKCGQHREHCEHGPECGQHCEHREYSAPDSRATFCATRDVAMMRLLCELDRQSYDGVLAEAARRPNAPQLLEAIYGWRARRAEGLVEDVELAVVAAAEAGNSPALDWLLALGTCGPDALNRAFRAAISGCRAGVRSGFCLIALHERGADDYAGARAEIRRRRGQTRMIGAETLLDLWDPPDEAALLHRAAEVAAAEAAAAEAEKAAEAAAQWAAREASE